MFTPSLFRSFFLAGFESSCHRLASGRRLDLISATCHDRTLAEDYARLRVQGISVVREALRWPLVETTPGHFDFSSLMPILQVAGSQGMQVVLDLCHFGWPDDIDIYKPEFVRRFAGLARSVAQLVASESDAVPYYIPITEISFMSWGGGEVGYLNPFGRGRGFELKAQLARAAIEGVEAIWSVDPRARIIYSDPLLNIVSGPEDVSGLGDAYHLAQYQAWDMIAGRLWPQLGGAEQYLDILGLNYYPTNQWIHNGPRLEPGHPQYRPLHSLLEEIHHRYYRPMLITETSTEGPGRPAWLKGVADEVAAAMAVGVQIHGICWYPILDYPGWDNDRYCPAGLWGYADETGYREQDQPLAEELRRQIARPEFTPTLQDGADDPERQPVKILHLPRFDFSTPSLSWTPTRSWSSQDAISSPPKVPDLVCFSHLRWDYVFQRPQHLMTRFASGQRVFFIEEPVLDTGAVRLEISCREPGVFVVTPHIPGLLSEAATHAIQKRLIADLFFEYGISRYLLWYYTPMALPFSRHLQPLVVIYDCMDELSLFKGSSPDLLTYEQELIQKADLVFTGGFSLYEAKRDRHPRVYPFPSSVDLRHYANARNQAADPVDQALILHPRIGFFGVLDERLDHGLIDDLAAECPEWQLVLIGPVAKIDPALLPRRSNIHYLGPKPYRDLPAYLAGWDVAIMPFALNEATRFISPTKTLEYLGGGKPVVSTPIHDVVHPYGETGLVQIASTTAQFAAAIETALAQSAEMRSVWLARTDDFLARTSWDATWAQMRHLIDQVIARKLV